jgi:hypothetical protein
MNIWMKPKEQQVEKEQPVKVAAPQLLPSGDGLTLPLHVGYDSLEKVVRSKCWRNFSNSYPLTRESAATFIPGKSEDEAIRAVRNMAASVVRQYYPTQTFTKSELRQAVIELEAYMAAGSGIDCNLPGHERRDPNSPDNGDIISLRFPA